MAEEEKAEHPVERAINDGLEERYRAFVSGPMMVAIRQYLRRVGREATKSMARGMDGPDDFSK